MLIEKEDTHGPTGADLHWFSQLVSLKLWPTLSGNILWRLQMVFKPKWRGEMVAVQAG